MQNSTFQNTIYKQLPKELFNEKDKSLRPPTIPIKKSRDEVYNFIRDPQNFPLFIKNLQSVSEQSSVLWKWIFVVDGKQHEEISEILHDIKGELFAWRIMNKQEVGDVGVIALREDPSGRGCLVSMKLWKNEKNPGKVTGILSQLAVGGNAKSDSFVSLRRLKAYLETGEVPTIEGQPNGNDENAH